MQRSLAVVCTTVSLSLGCADHDDAPHPRASQTALPTGDQSQLDASASLLDASSMDARIDVASSTRDAAPVGIRTSIVLPDRWVSVDQFHDPFSDRPPAVSCDRASVMAETLSDVRVLSVDTGGCNYVTATQPSLRDIAVGDVLKVRLWHFSLTAPMPAEAHAAVLVDGLSVLDERIPIPQDGAELVTELRADRAIPAGAPVYFHLHNHGSNSWSLVEVSSGP